MIIITIPPKIISQKTISGYDQKFFRAELWQNLYQQVPDIKKLVRKLEKIHKFLSLFNELIIPRCLVCFSWVRLGFIAYQSFEVILIIFTHPSARAG